MSPADRLMLELARCLDRQLTRTVGKHRHLQTCTRGLPSLLPAGERLPCSPACIEARAAIAEACAWLDLAPTSLDSLPPMGRPEGAGRPPRARRRIA